MADFALLNTENLIINIIVAETEEIANACSWGARVVKIDKDAYVTIGMTYLENNEWSSPEVIES